MTPSTESRELQPHRGHAAGCPHRLDCFSGEDRSPTGSATPTKGRGGRDLIRTGSDSPGPVKAAILPATDISCLAGIAELERERKQKFVPSNPEQLTRSHATDRLRKVL